MDGIVIINKEKGYTSNDVVQIVKKTINEKVGHTGTLDPMATGVLPLLIGKGTLISKYLINHDKIYTATLKLGIKTDTGDITGNVIEKNHIVNLDKNNVIKVLSKVKGKQKQIPPMYSAIKVNGKKLYEYARQGEKIEVKARDIEVYDIELESINLETNEIQFRVNCSKGTYIRTLCESIAEKLGTVGTMSALRREKVGEFEINQAIRIEEIKQKSENKEFIKSNIISIEKFFEKKDEILLSPRSYIAFINGVKLFTDNENNIYRIYNENKQFIGIGNVKNGILKRDIVI